MRVDLDELERLEKATRERASTYVTIRRSPAEDDYANKLALIGPSIIAELRAARECARLLKIALPRLIHTEIVFQAMCLEACEAHKKATKGDG